jgi:hypothetical protein
MAIAQPSVNVKEENFRGGVMRRRKLRADICELRAARTAPYSSGCEKQCRDATLVPSDQHPNGECQVVRRKGSPPTANVASSAGRTAPRDDEDHVIGRTGRDDGECCVVCRKKVRLRLMSRRAPKEGHPCGECHAVRRKDSATIDEGHVIGRKGRDYGGCCVVRRKEA